MLPALNQRYAAHPDMAPFRALLPGLLADEPGAEERFIEAWNGFLAANGF